MTVAVPELNIVLVLAFVTLILAVRVMKPPGEVTVT